MIHDDYNEDEDPFEKALGLSSVPTQLSHTVERLPEIVPEQKVEIRTYVQNDYEFTRKNGRDLLAVGSQLLQNAVVAAQQTGTPDGYAAAAQILKTLIDANEKLLKLSETHAKVTDGKKNEIKKEKEETTVIDNRTINVTAMDMLNFVKKAKDGNTEE